VAVHQHYLHFVVIPNLINDQETRPGGGCNIIDVSLPELRGHSDFRDQLVSDWKPRDC
jgi:hypothetical protein